MPISQFLGNSKFDPETRRIMGLAFEMTRLALGLADRGDIATDAEALTPFPEPQHVYATGGLRDGVPDGFAALTAGDPDGSGRIIRNAAHLYVAQRSSQVQRLKRAAKPEAQGPGAILPPSDGEADK